MGPRSMDRGYEDSEKVLLLIFILILIPTAEVADRVPANAATSQFHLTTET